MYNENITFRVFKEETKKLYSYEKVIVSVNYWVFYSFE
jgi:hypothetical protein